MFIQNSKILLNLFFLFTFLLFSSVGQAQDDSLTNDENYENYEYSEDEENLLYNDSSSVDNTSTASDEYYSKKNGCSKS
jgi:hypothetical protein